MLSLQSYLCVCCRPCIGETSVRDDIGRLQDGQHTVVDALGFVFDMLIKHPWPIDDLPTLNCDEADGMLSRVLKRRDEATLRVVRTKAVYRFLGVSTRPFLAWMSASILSSPSLGGRACR